MDAETKKHIVALLKQRGLTQAQFAELVGVTPMAVSRWLNCDVRLSTLFKIAAALGVHITELFPPPESEGGKKREEADRVPSKLTKFVG